MDMIHSAEEIAEKISRMPSEAVSMEAAHKAFADVQPARFKIVNIDKFHDKNFFSKNAAIEKIRQQRTHKMDKTITVSGDEDGMLRKAIELATIIDSSKIGGNEARFWDITPGVGMTFYKHYASHSGKKLLPVPLGAEGIYTIAVEWLKSDEAKKIRDAMPCDSGGDGSYSDGWKITNEVWVDVGDAIGKKSIPDGYSQVLTVIPYTIYYGK